MAVLGVEDKDPTLLADLDSLVDPQTRGDPECMLRWTTKSTAKLANALGRWAIRCRRTRSPGC
ncbi:MAG: hypothetical protein IPH38_19650 [Candidatus Microthrix sp.]|nr:hypothetical protein [Candidatus Microthrix sp.]